MTRSLLLLALLGVASLAEAQPVPPVPPVAPVPGVAPAPPLPPGPIFDADRLDALFARPPKVEVNLTGALLRMAGSFAGDDDPEVADMVRGLRGITVRVYSLSEASDALTAGLADLSRSFADRGWQTMVRVRASDEDSEDVSILVRALDRGFDGMVVMALDDDDDEAAFVFIDGPIDLEHLADISDRFAGTRLDGDAEQAAERAAEDAERAAEAAERAVEAAERRAEEARRRAEDAARRAEDVKRQQEERP